VERKKAEAFESRRWPAPGAEEEGGTHTHARAKRINMEKMDFARSGAGVGRSGAGRQPSALAGAGRLGPGPTGTHRAAAPGSGQGKTPAETPGPGLAASVERAAGGRGGGGRGLGRVCVAPADFTTWRKAFVGCSAGRQARGAAPGAAVTWLPAAGQGDPAPGPSRSRISPSVPGSPPRSPD